MLKTARKPPKDPEGRMPLTEHLRELRNRLGKAALAVVIVAIVAAFFAKDIMGFLTDPVPICEYSASEEAREKRCAVLAQNGLLAPFGTYIRVSLLVGLIVASPVWLYQFWAFIAPGLHKNEKKYSRAVVGVGVPLFLTGTYFAYWLLPRAIPVMLSFSADESQNFVTVEEVLDITVRLALAFGISFELPLLLVLLNLGGVITGKRMLSWWRWMVMGIAVFAAAITPTDLLSMIALQIPVTGLYFLACGIALLNDRRRARRDPNAGLSDDEASDLDLTPEAVGPAQRLDDDGDRRVNGYDDDAT
ncbi:sec-independent protein translocase protein TatC [Streptomyces zhaozhouensis]|uniref:Sec-independent protein translocase protein TatC n=1 Tax=Streptomyces zhaozhouensis TaxID=1300267 RepID=A0A286DS41_9ACTN|nr:twin-arginine translocase subunit TatC [Streptomyces zhaozhouensis]SOD61465.1 sec-independent protein translocase protein TatC [Streptomyces zhaozhouensis]